MLKKITIALVAAIAMIVSAEAWFSRGVPSGFPTGPTAAISWYTTYQTMDGFSGQTWVYGDNLTSAQADMFFSDSAGIGLTYARTANTSDESIPDLVSLLSCRCNHHQPP